jgi:LacI family transcriptional regulator
VVGVDNDQLLCELADPPLSSVALNAEGTGYQAAALLDRMMKHKVRKPRHLKARPLHVVTRHSTDIVAVDDADVAAALRFIRSQAVEPIQVEDVVRHLAMSRRTLEVRFQSVVGRTVHAELHRVRMERARRLLMETDLPIPTVAESVGYSTPSYFIQVFRAEHDTTPAKYRRHLRDNSKIN